MAAIDQAREQVDDLIGTAERYYGRGAFVLGDWLSRRWLERSANPYRDEIHAVGSALGRRGAAILNLSYEWGCTTAVGPDPAGRGSRLLRSLDWRMSGVGRNVVVVRQQGAAGGYLSVTWPGFVGVVTAMAPGRFSAAINQPELRLFTRFRWADWVVGRQLVWRSTGLPPAHLLRLAFDTCHTYDEARRLLMETPLCMPAFFILSGLTRDEGCVIERFEGGAEVHDGPSSIANQWLKRSRRGHAGVPDSVGRKALIDSLRDRSKDGFDWVVPPILNSRTRVTVIANAERRFLTVQGWEHKAPATRPLVHVEPCTDGGADSPRVALASLR